VQKVLLIALAGGLGTLGRYTLSGLVHRVLGASFPAGTFVVNCLGCLLFGVAWSVIEDRLSLPPDTRIIVLTGFMGAFTTFSTFVFETSNLLNAGQWLYAFANCAGQIIVGMALLWLGLYAGKML